MHCVKSGSNTIGKVCNFGITWGHCLRYVHTIAWGYTYFQLLQRCSPMNPVHPLMSVNDFTSIVFCLQSIFLNHSCIHKFVLFFIWRSCEFVVVMIETDTIILLAAKALCQPVLQDSTCHVTRSCCIFFLSLLVLIVKSSLLFSERDSDTDRHFGKVCGLGEISHLK